MSTFLLGGRAWQVIAVNHDERVVRVKGAPRGKKPSWGGYLPQFLGYEVCQEMKAVLTSDEEIPYLDKRAKDALAEWRSDLGALLKRARNELQYDGEVVTWWTFAGGRINQTLKYALEWKGGWKVIPDNFALKIQGNGVTHETVRSVIDELREPGFWAAAETRQKLYAMVPEYRLSKFQRVLPERWQVEMVGAYLLDFAGTAEWLTAAQALGSGQPARREPEWTESTKWTESTEVYGVPLARSERNCRVQLQMPGGDVAEHLRPALSGRWLELPDQLSADDLNVVAHTLNGYEIAEQYLGGPGVEAFGLARAMQERWETSGEWTGTAVELLSAFFCTVRAWRGCEPFPGDGSEHHRQAQSLYTAVRHRLQAHPDEAELVPVEEERL